MASLLIQLIAGPSWDSGQFHSSLHDLAERLKRRESFSNLIVRVTIDGSHRWWELSASPKVDENGGFAGFRGVGSDVTEQRESSEKIAYLASYDTLTGLPNRMMVTDTLGEAMADADKWRTRCAFLMIDLDRFKAVNDTLGHLVGDQLLALVSERLRKLMTDNELCGRLGGDEFAIVLRDASDTDRIAHVAQAVIHALSQPYQVDSHTLYVGASVGSAIGPRDGATVETLMRNADLALYRAKDSGGGMHCNYEPALHAHAEERRQLEFALRRALERNELHLTYQPVVDATSEQLVSFEALLRWNSAEHGMVSPAKFIPLAEDTRLIVPIGEWVLRMACLEAVRWPDPIKIAVNVSGEQLLDPAFADTVVSALSASGCRRTGWRSKSPKAFSCAMERPRRRPCSASWRWAAAWRWMTSAPAIPRWDTCGRCGFPRSRSIASSCRAPRARTRKPGDRARRGGDGGQPGNVDHGRRRGDRGATGGDPRARLQEDPGYYFGRPMPAEDARAVRARIPAAQRRGRLSPAGQPSGGDQPLTTLSNSTRSVPPCAASIMRSGWGIMPSTLPRSLSTPAISRCEPLTGSA
jgi:diguanylate cyclase (GGDEF)-like protein